MAIDILEKRASSTNHWLGTILPLSDGTISASDRIQVGGEYSGIAAAAADIIEREIINLVSQLARNVLLDSKITQNVLLESKIGDN